MRERYEFKDDCIHLKACRRLQKIAKNKGIQIPRNCTEKCTAYISGDDGEYVSVDDAIDYARNGASMIENGYDKYDTYCSCDLHGKNIREIINSGG